MQGKPAVATIGFHNIPEASHTMQHDRNVLLDRLSARERQVLELTAAGRSVAQIAALIGVSSSTIEIYRNRIMVKLDIYDLPGLVRFARHYGVVAASPNAA
jgi:DNA-binding NarL/FixJ family response regulator